MSYVLYYRSSCPESITLLESLSCYKNIIEKIHFICTDSLKDGYVMLPNNTKIIVPPITQTPALVSLSFYKIIYGDKIYSELANAPVQFNRDITSPLSHSESSANVKSYTFAQKPSNVVSGSYGYVTPPTPEQSSQVQKLNGYIGAGEINVINARADKFSKSQYKA